MLSSFVKYVSHRMSNSLLICITFLLWLRCAGNCNCQHQNVGSTSQRHPYGFPSADYWDGRSPNYGNVDTNMVCNSNLSLMIIDVYYKMIYNGNKNRVFIIYLVPDYAANPGTIFIGTRYAIGQHWV